MKKIQRAVMSAALVGSLALPVVAQAQQIVLKLHHFTASTGYVQTQLIEPWCAKLAKESQDRLKCQIYPSMQLGGTPAQLIEQARDGIADIIFTNPAYQPGPFVKTEAFVLPFLVKNPVTASRAMWDFVQQHALDEYRGTKPMLMFLGDHTGLHFAKSPAPTLEDIKGRKVRAAGRWEAKILASLGMLPVQLAAPQITESVSKGVIDGVLVPWSGYPLLKLGDVTRFHTDFAKSQTKMNYPILAIVMNQARYDSLPPDLQKAVDAVSGREMSAWGGQVYAESMETGYAAARTAKAVIAPLSDAEHARWVKATAGVKDEWVAEVNSKGGDGKKLLESASTLIRQYDK